MQGPVTRLLPLPEQGQDSWYVCAPQGNLLFYSKDPVVKVATRFDHCPAAAGSESPHDEIDIRTTDQGHWTDLLRQAHENARLASHVF